MEEKVSGVSIVLYICSKVVSQSKNQFLLFVFKEGWEERGRRNRLEKKTLTL